MNINRDDKLKIVKKGYFRWDEGTVLDVVDFKANHLGGIRYSLRGPDGMRVTIDSEDIQQYCSKAENNQNAAFGKQVGGSHYSKLKIQPMQYSLANDLNYAQANAIKYITRYKDKNGIEDLKKAIHCLELLIEFEQSGS